MTDPSDRFADGVPAEAYDFVDERASSTVKKRKPANTSAPKLSLLPLNLILNKDGFPLSNIANVCEVLSRHHNWQGVLAFDEFAQAVISRSPPPVRAQDKPSEHVTGEWSDEDSIRTVAWMSSECGFSPQLHFVEAAVRVIARRHSFHPVREYFQRQKWDGKPRLDYWLSRYFDAKQSEYTAAVGSRWLISAVARIMEPGCKADCMLVIEGVQGAGKSSAFEALASKAWFADTPLDLGNKDSYQGLRRKLIYEIGELASFKGKELGRIKNFVSAYVDNYRPSFGRKNQDFPRQLVFAGTTNDDDYLLDPTGARRFWPVRGGKVDVSAIREDRDQLWAEAFLRYQQKEKWYVDTPELEALCKAEQELRRPDDPIKEMLRQWLVSPRIKRHEDSDKVLPIHEGILISDAILGCLQKRPGDVRDSDSQRMGRLFKELGWVRKRRSMIVDDQRAWAYFPPDVGQLTLGGTHGTDETA